MSFIIAFHAVAATALVVTGLVMLLAPKRRRGRHGRLGDVYFWLLAIALGSGMVVGLRDPALSPFEIATPPTFALGLGGWLLAKRRPRGWLQWHIAGQGGSYIGVITATLFQIVPRVTPDSAVIYALIWALPTIVGSVLIARTTARRLGTVRTS
jgi:uncharacterized membrane protein YeaQ/YmgE (transglycosylase-associated protein family)